MTLFIQQRHWEVLKTSYGVSAKDIPNTIRKVLSEDKTTRSNAGLHLWRLLCGDYILAEAALEATPILIELLKVPEVSDESKIEILFILNDLPIVHVRARDEQRKKAIQTLIRQEIDLYLHFLQRDGTELQEFAASMLFSKDNFPPSEYSPLKEIYLNLKQRVSLDRTFIKDFAEYDEVWLVSDTKE